MSYYLGEPATFGHNQKFLPSNWGTLDVKYDILKLSRWPKLPELFNLFESLFERRRIFVFFVVFKVFFVGDKQERVDREVYDMALAANSMVDRIIFNTIGMQHFY